MMIGHSKIKKNTDFSIMLWAQWVEKAFLNLSRELMDMVGMFLYQVTTLLMKLPLNSLSMRFVSPGDN